MILNVVLVVVFFLTLISAASFEYDLLRFGNDDTYTRETLKEIFLKRSTSYPDNFDPFSYSLMKSFVDDNPVTASFFDHLFNNPTGMFEFDVGIKGSWEALLTLNLTTFKTINPEEYREIVRAVIVPGYKLLKAENVHVILNDKDDDDEFEYLLYVLERESFNNFVLEYKKIIQSFCPDEEKKLDLKSLLLIARRDVNFKSKHGKYHFEFLLQVPFDILKDINPNGSDFDDCFATMAQAAYDRMTRSVEGSDEALLILSSILPSVYDKVSGACTFQQMTCQTLP